MTETAQDNLFDALRPLALFAHMCDSELVVLAGRLSSAPCAAGATIMQEGEQATAAFLILDGEVEIFRLAGSQPVQIAVRGPGELIGEMGLLTGERRNATARALVDSLILTIPTDTFERFLIAEPSAMRALLRTTTLRLQQAEAHLVQHQKMAALGTLAAGLTHELNNPAAAVSRSVEHLRSAMSDWEVQSRTLGALVLAPEQEAALAALRDELPARASSLQPLDPLARGDREQAMQRWLASQHVADTWRLAPLLVDGGWDVDALERAMSPFTGSSRATLLCWLAAGQAVHGLLYELGVGARAISEIVTAVKTYTRLDQGPLQEVDLHEGLEHALLIVRHKLRGVTLTRHYAPDLPRMTVFASELNQVWTNLLDNALDALDGHGELSIETRLDRDRSRVAIEIGDSGPGLAPGARDRLFEPFFTTKPVGQGTGLGLSISYNIVRKHRGDIQVESRPGRTRFTVLLPVQGVHP